MRIERRYTTEARGAYEGLAFREAFPHGSAAPTAVTVPSAWSDGAAAALAEALLQRSGVPARRKRVEEPGIPAFLRRSTASETLMADLAEADRFGGESDARQFFDRFAGRLAYRGWKSGYFDGEGDARAFLDEVRFMMATQMAAPSEDLARSAGLFWAYGIEAPVVATPAPDRPAPLTVRLPPDEGGDAIDAEDARAAAAVGSAELRFVAATGAWGGRQPPIGAAIATMNLLAFRTAGGAFDAAGFQHAARLWTIALDIAAGEAERPVGLGCANLAALLAATALPYDSPRARAMAAAILALMTGAAYAASAEMAAELGTLTTSTDTMALSGILADHRRAARGLPADDGSARRWVPLERAACPDDALLARVDRAFETGAERAARHGFRNAAVTLAGEAGLAAALLDLETAGIRAHPAPTRESLPSPSPGRALFPSLRDALRTLRYREAEIADIAAFVALGAVGEPPHLRAEHAALLAPAGHEAQIRMAAAVQPFVSGDVAQTADLPADSGPAQFQAAATLAWRLGLKTLRLHRLTTRAVPAVAADTTTVAVDRASADGPAERERQELPDRRTGYTRKIAAGLQEAYLHTGEYADGRLGEVFIDMHREEAAFRALMDEFSSAVSLGLQHGVPLEAYVESFVRDDALADRAERSPASILDAVFRDLAASYLGRTDLAEASERVISDRRGRGTARGWRLPMPRAAVDLPMPGSSTGPLAASEPTGEPLRAPPKLPRTDAFPLDRLTGARSK